MSTPTTTVELKAGMLKLIQNRLANLNTLHETATARQKQVSRQISDERPSVTLRAAVASMEDEQESFNQSLAFCEEMYSQIQAM